MPAREAPAVAVTGLALVSALGRGAEANHRRALAGEPAFGPVRRFDAERYRVGVAACLPAAGALVDELAGAVAAACDQAGLDATDRSTAPLLVAGHGDPSRAGPDLAADTGWTPAAVAAAVSQACGLPAPARCYTSACVAASTAVADAAATVAAGRAECAVVAAGYLVDEEYHALFDAGRALAGDGAVRPFSARRRGLLLGDGVAAVVLESAAAARRRDADVLGWLAGWGRAGDAYHVCQPRPDGDGLARAITAALRRAGLQPADVGYVNAHGTGTAHNDPAEAAALCRALGTAARDVPVSSTKSVHGHTLEAAGLVELVITLMAVRTGWLPVNASYLGPDEACPLDVVVDEPREVRLRYALSTNSAFGGANTALLVAAP